MNSTKSAAPQPLPKIDSDGTGVVHYGFLQFMVDCVVRFERRLEHGVALHRLEMTKYRGSDFVAGEFPVSFGPSGMEVSAPEPAESAAQTRQGVRQPG